MFPPLVQPDKKRFTTIQSRFEQFHKLNPWVYKTLCTLARTMLVKGHQKIGVKMIWEVLRWHYYQQTVDVNRDFKLNNNYHAHYARLIMAQEPDLKGIFETRKLTAA